MEMATGNSLYCLFQKISYGDSQLTDIKQRKLGRAMIVYVLKGFRKKWLKAKNTHTHHCRCRFPIHKYIYNWTDKMIYYSFVSSIHLLLCLYLFKYCLHLYLVRYRMAVLPPKCLSLFLFCFSSAYILPLLLLLMHRQPD